MVVVISLPSNEHLLTCSYRLDHILELPLGGILSQGSEDAPNVLLADTTCALFVKETECFSQLGVTWWVKRIVVACHVVWFRGVRCEV